MVNQNNWVFTEYSRKLKSSSVFKVQHSSFREEYQRRNLILHPPVTMALHFVIIPLLTIGKFRKKSLAK